MARTSNKDKALAYAADKGSALDTLRTTLNAGPTTPPRPRRHDQHNEANVWAGNMDKCPACGDNQRPCKCGLL